MVTEFKVCQSQQNLLVPLCCGQESRLLPMQNLTAQLFQLAPFQQFAAIFQLYPQVNINNDVPLSMDNRVYRCGKNASDPGR
jgi:hypothetical protein